MIPGGPGAGANVPGGPEAGYNVPGEPGAGADVPGIPGAVVGVPFLLCSLSLTLSNGARLLFLVGGVSCVEEEEKLNLKLLI